MSSETAAKAAMLEAMVTAALQGHDIGAFETVTDRPSGGYEARCRRCAGTVWIGQ